MTDHVQDPVLFLEADDWRGAVAVVTGGARGIGRAVVERLAALGVQVIAGDADAGGLEAMAGPGVTTQVADVADPGQCERLVALAASRFGRIDFLINSAGVSGVQKPVWELSAADFEVAWRINTLGAFSCIRAAAPLMMAARSGAIVNISSVASKNPQANRAAYASSKTALVGLSRVVAVELAPYRVRCNVISPGPVSGPRLDELVAASAAAQARSTGAVRDDMYGLMPMGEPTTPEEVAGLATYLCSSMARHLTGEDINLDSGIPAY